MKKILILSVILLLSITGCDKKKKKRVENIVGPSPIEKPIFQLETCNAKIPGDVSMFPFCIADKTGKILFTVNKCDSHGGDRTVNPYQPRYCDVNGVRNETCNFAFFFFKPSNDIFDCTINGISFKIDHDKDCGAGSEQSAFICVLK